MEAFDAYGGDDPPWNLPPYSNPDTWSSSAFAEIPSSDLTLDLPTYILQNNALQDCVQTCFSTDWSADLTDGFFKSPFYRSMDSREHPHTTSTEDSLNEVFANSPSPTLVRRSRRSKPFQCGLCEKSFFKLEWMNTHSRSHRGESVRVPCSFPACSKSFRRVHDLRRHLRSHIRPRFRDHHCRGSLKPTTLQRLTSERKKKADRYLQRMVIERDSSKALRDKCRVLATTLTQNATNNTLNLKRLLSPLAGNAQRVWRIGLGAMNNVLDNKCPESLRDIISLILMADSMRSVPYLGGDRLCNRKEFRRDLHRYAQMVAPEERSLFDAFTNYMYRVNTTEKTYSPFEPTENLTHFHELFQQIVSRVDPNRTERQSDKGGEENAEYLYVDTDVVLRRKANKSDDEYQDKIPSSARRWRWDLGDVTLDFQISVEKPPWPPDPISPAVVILAATIIFGIVLACILAWQNLEAVNSSLELWRGQYGDENTSWSASVARNCIIIAALLGLPSSYTGTLNLDHGLSSWKKLSFWDDACSVVPYLHNTPSSALSPRDKMTVHSSPTTSAMPMPDTSESLFSDTRTDQTDALSFLDNIGDLDNELRIFHMTDDVFSSPFSLDTPDIISPIPLNEGNSISTSPSTGPTPGSSATSTGSFSCPKCAKTFDKKFNLNKHLRTTKSCSQGVPGRERFICEYCTKESTTKSNLEAHMKKFCSRRPLA